MLEHLVETMTLCTIGRPVIHWMATNTCALKTEVESPSGTLVPM